jgi:predicted transcriptional regulator
MKELTKAEEEIMEYLWKLQKGFVRDILEQFSDPKPAYTTVSTIIRILEKKGMVGYIAYGKNYEYYPLVSKKDYARLCFKHVLTKHYSSSWNKFASFFSSDEDVSLTELEELKKIIEEQIDHRKNKENG